MKAGTVTVGTTPTLIVTAGQLGWVSLQNSGGTAVVLGGSGVGTTGGLSLPANMTTPVMIPIGDGQRIYGIVASGSSTIAYLAST